MISKTMSALLFVLLAGCATSYQDAGLTGGHFEKKGPGQLEVVYFSANGYSDSQVVMIYAIYRCAEVARKKHKPYFVIYDSLSDAARDRVSQNPVMGWVQNKPVATAYVLFLDQSRHGAQDTQEVLNRYRDTIITGKPNQS